jgi:hypothetical protein
MVFLRSQNTISQYNYWGKYTFMALQNLWFFWQQMVIEQVYLDMNDHPM